MVTRSTDNHRLSPKTRRTAHRYPRPVRPIDAEERALIARATGTRDVLAALDRDFNGWEP